MPRKKVNPKLAQRQIAMLNRRRKVLADLRRRPSMTTSELAARHGVTPKTIWVDLKAIREMLRDDLAREVRYSKEMQLDRYLETAGQADQTYEASREPEETIRTEMVKVNCPMCGGGGTNGKGKACPGCEGEGVVLNERQMRTLKGQPGDPSALNTKLKALERVDKLLGHEATAKADPGQGGSQQFIVDKAVFQLSREEVLRPVVGQEGIDNLRRIGCLDEEEAEGEGDNREGAEEGGEP